jgi:hypothetical protein
LGRWYLSAAWIDGGIFIKVIIYRGNLSGVSLDYQKKEWIANAVLEKNKEYIRKYDEQYPLGEVDKERYAEILAGS